VRLRPYPPPSPTYWQDNGQPFPKASWCATCGRPSALKARYACPEHLDDKEKK
jgi:hypothetical protein